jgi:hypothetical protein
LISCWSASPLRNQVEGVPRLRAIPLSYAVFSVSVGPKEVARMTDGTGRADEYGRGQLKEPARRPIP